MDLTIDSTKVGEIYFNIKLEISKTGLSLPDLKAKLANKQLQAKVDSISFTVDSYRKYYTDNEYLYVEGAVLKF